MQKDAEGDGDDGEHADKQKDLTHREAFRRKSTVAEVRVAHRTSSIQGTSETGDDNSHADPYHKATCSSASPTRPEGCWSSPKAK